MSKAELVYLGLGTNVGERKANLEEALRRIQGLQNTRVEKIASAWETPPVGYLDQAPFYNTACAVLTRLEPTPLLSQLKAIETSMGRLPGPRYGPRLIDIDILLYGQTVMDGPPTIPHPEMHRRAFVLAPLAEIAPDAVVPGKASVAALLQHEDTAGLVRLPEPLDAP